MKKILILSCSLLIFLTIAFATDAVKNEERLVGQRNRDFFLGKHLEVYKYIPSNLVLWKAGDFSSINLKANLEKGDFKLVDEFDMDRNMSFFSESVQSFTTSKWRFWGRFTFNISNHDRANWNLGYKKTEVGNPFRLITKRTGDFNVKQYGLEGIANKTLNEKWSVAVATKYFGDLYYRISDTRNSFTNLSILLNTSASYHLSANRSISLGAEFNRKKSNPSFTNSYKASGSAYNLYFNEGLGDFNQIALSTDIYYKANYPRFTVGYFSGVKNKFTLQYGLETASEKWEYRISSTTSTTDELLYKYDYLKNELQGSYLLNTQNTQIFNLVKANYTLGTGYRNQSNILQKTYLYDAFNIKVLSKINRPKSHLFYGSEININFDYSNRKDMIYAQRINYANLLATAETGYLFSISEGNTVSIDGKIGYKFNVDYTHELGAASGKPYTLNLAYNEVAYYSSDYFLMGGKVRWNRNLKQFSSDLFFGIEYKKTTNILYTNVYSILEENSNRVHLSAGFSIYF